MVKINAGKLREELKQAGIETNGTSADGLVWDLNNKEIQNTKAVKGIIAKHDPTEIPIETIEEKLEKLESKVEVLASSAASSSEIKR